MTAFVVIEGPNGVGKSTVVASAAAILQAGGVTVHTTKEPSGTLLGAAIRELESSLPPEALALACAADRYDHVEREIEPALHEGRIVISDRYVPSSLVLQRLDGLDLAYVWLINKDVRPADLTVYLEDDERTIDERLITRAAGRRFEARGTVAQELALYREAQSFLSERGWKHEVVDQRGRVAEDVGREVAERVIEFVSGRPGRM